MGRKDQLANDLPYRLPPLPVTMWYCHVITDGCNDWLHVITAFTGSQPPCHITGVKFNEKLHHLLIIEWLQCWLLQTHASHAAVACSSPAECTDLYYACGAQGVLPMRVGGATRQLDLPSLTPLSIAGCGWLQLGVPQWAASVHYCK